MKYILINIANAVVFSVGVLFLIGCLATAVVVSIMAINWINGTVH